MFGVRGPARAKRQHEVIAGPFTLGAQMTGANPGQRVEPVRGAGRVRDRLHHAIAARHVRQFMAQHDADALVAPRQRAFGQRERGAQEAARERHRDLRRGHETRRLCQTELRSRDVHRVAPVGVHHVVGSTDQCIDRCEADQVPRDQCECDHCPREQRPFKGTEVNWRRQWTSRRRRTARRCPRRRTGSSW